MKENAENLGMEMVDTSALDISTASTSDQASLGSVNGLPRG
jgi:hypothetical protein